MSEQLSNVDDRVSRSVVACNACRTKKQKCGGEKPTCVRCQQLDLECVWPRQQKRGPAKGYTEALEARLSDIEEVLFRVLTCVDTQDLSRVLTENPLDTGSSSRVAALDRKQAVDIWSKSPMKSVADIQNWYEERSHMADSASKSEAADSISSNQEPPFFASYKRSITPKEQSRPAAVEQHELPIEPTGRLTGGSIGRFGAESTSTKMSVGPRPVLFEMDIDMQTMQQSQSQQHLQSQPQHHGQSSPQSHFLHTQASPMPPSQMQSQLRYHEQPDTLSQYQNIRSSPTPLNRIQSQPQQHEQPISQAQSQHIQSSLIPKNQNNAVAEEFSERINGAEDMNALPMGIPRKIQDDFFW